MKTLVIAEKPSVARDIARVLGCAKKRKRSTGRKPVYCDLGAHHLVTLKDPEDYDKKYKEWNMAVLPMMPEKLQIKVIPQTGKQYHAVTTQLARKDVGEVVIATDAGTVKASWWRGGFLTRRTIRSRVSVSGFRPLPTRQSVRDLPA